LCNHTAAGFLGEWVRSLLDPAVLRWALGISFLAVAAWALVPDRLENEKHAQAGRWGVFATTAIAFFLAEIGDKTQVATIMLAAKYHALVLVVAGTTLGMLIADVPAVFVGTVAAARLPMKAVRIVAALLFGALGVAAIAGFSL
jgi:putative Ca2+/H+ antiporter (TMEM165/GDT1 family)